jgi:glycosyltransferase involved in cell wall biosynthesis
MSLDISVVIPCYNAEKLIEQTIASVLSQASVELELVVVDDGSADGSRALVSGLAARDSRIRLVAQANGGVSAARNTGYRACSPDSRYVMFIDADDLLRPGALSLLRRRLDGEHDLAAAFGQCARIDGQGVLLAAPPPEFVSYRAEADRISTQRGLERLGFWDVLPITPISTPGQCLLRRSEVPQQPFDSAFTWCEDWDLWLLLSRSGDIGVERGEVLAYRDNVSSASKQYHGMREQRGEVYRKHMMRARPDELSRFVTAFRFGMYTFDARLCSQWARQAWSRGQWTAALRFAGRSARFHVSSAATALTRMPGAFRP